jgi:hypothetical protein
MKKISNTSIVYFALAMAAGVFYREFTKFNGFTGFTTLGVVHTHLLVLGMVMFLVIALFGLHDKALLRERSFSRFFVLYNIGLPLMAVMMTVRGIVQVQGMGISTGMSAMISGIAGISHIMMLIAFILLFISLKKTFIKE